MGKSQRAHIFSFKMSLNDYTKNEELQRRDAMNDIAADREAGLLTGQGDGYDE